MHNSQICDQLEFDSESNQMTRDPISIFTWIREEDNKKHKMLLEKLRNEFPDGFKIGAAAGKGDCFFDSVAQGLKELKDNGVIKSEEGFNVQSLRKCCADYVRKHYRQDNWICKEVIKDAAIGGYFCASIGPYGPIQDPNTKTSIIGSEDTFNKYLGDIEKIAEKIEQPIWGRPEIEGKMISNEYDVSLYCYSISEQFDKKDDQKTIVTKITPNSDSIEVFIKGSDWNKFKIDSNEKFVGIVNYKQHFVPLLISLKEDIEESKRVSREEVYGTEYREYDIKKTDSDSQPISSFKVNERLEEFIRYFVEKFEAKLHAYHLILEGKIKKTEKFSEKIGQGVGGAVGGLVGFFLGSPVTGGKFGAAAGKAGGKKIGNKKYTEKVAMLSDLIDIFRNDKTNFRQRLAEAGFDIFQSFEMQFMRVTTDQGPKKAMQLLAQDAVNRAIKYYIQKKGALISEAVVLGTSKIESVWGVPIPNSKIKINYKHQSSEKEWNTAGLYEKVGLVRKTETLSYYEKGDGKSRTDKYGYRRLLESEIWDNCKNKYSSSRSLTEQFTNYPYILNSSDSEKKSEDILKKINLDDKDLEEERIKETIEELKNDIMEEMKLLESPKNEATEDVREILGSIKANLENLKVDEYLEKFKESIEAGREENRKNFNQLSEKQDNYHDDNKGEHRKTQAGVERIEEKINKVHEVFVEKKSEQIEQSGWFGVRPPVYLFTGREKELKNLHDALQQNQGKNKFTVISQMASISGSGGIGKTQLARKYAANYTNDYDNNVIWINAENLTTMESSFRELAKYIRISETDTDGKNRTITSIIEEIYRFIKKKKCLFIFDNAEKNDDFDKFLPLRNLSPADNMPYILITSRDREWEEGIEVINLNELELNEGVELVRNGLKIAEDVSELEKLVKKLQGFPLAIQQAISYIASQSVTGECTINHYIDEYNKKAEDLLNYNVCKGIDNDYSRTTFTTWQITIDKIARNQQYGELALKILNTIAYFAPENITRDMFLRLADNNNEELKSAVHLLVKYSMVSGKQMQSILNIHRLLQEVTRLELKEKKKEEEVLRKALELIKDSNVETESRSHVTSVWSYASNHYNLIVDFYNYYYNGKFRDKVTPLHLLAEEGNDTAIKKILEHKKEKSPNTLGEVVNPSGRQTPLHVAIINDKLNVIELLLRNDANVYAIDETISPGKTTLELAADYGSKDTVNHILHNFEIKKIKDSNLAMICLYNAVCYNTLDVIECFINIIDKNFLQKEIYGTRLLHHAAKRRNLDIIKYLERVGLDFGKDSSEETPLHYAAEGGNLSVVTHFVEEKGAVINDNAKGSGFLRGTPLHFAADGGKLEVVKYLVEKGAEIDTQNTIGSTPIHYTAKRGNLELVWYLVGKGAKFNTPNKYGKTPLHYAADWERLKLVKYFVEEKGADIEANAEGGEHSSDGGGTPLHYAAFRGRTFEVVKYLVEKGAEINGQNNYGRTPLHYATECGNLEVVKYLVKYLVEKGTEFNAQNKYGMRLLSYAIESGTLEVVKYLVETGAKINDQDKYGNTPLHRAARKGRLNVVKYFVEEKGADIEANAIGGQYSSDGGGTPLHYAARSGKANVVKYLVEKRAKTDAKNIKGDTPLALAKRWFSIGCTRHYEKTIKILQEVDYTHQVPGDPTQPKECLPDPSSGNRGKIQKAYLGGKAEYPGKLSSKECNKFMVEFYKGLDVTVNQPMQQILHNSTLEVNDVKKQILEPKSYLNNTSVQDHLAQARDLKLRQYPFSGAAGNA